MEKQTEFLSVNMVKEQFPFLSTGTLANMRCKKQGPKYFKLNKKVLYQRSDLEAWFISQPVQTIDSIQ